MPRNKQGGMRRKKRVHMVKESPFPIPMSTSSPGEPGIGQWSYYTGYIEGSAVVVKHSGDMEFLYKMGFFGKGTLSRSQPNFHERNHRVRVEMLYKKHDHDTSVQAIVVNKRSYLVHRRYKALADGRTKEYSDVVHHEEQQQGFVDSTDEEMDEDSSDDSSSSNDVESGKMIAFKLLNSTGDSTNELPETSSYSAGEEPPITAKVRSSLVSILAELSVLSNEQITTFLRVPQDMRQLTEKFKRLRSAEIKLLRQMYSAQFPGRHFKQGEVITLDEDDSAGGENENAVVISDSDEAAGDDSEKMDSENTQSTGLLSRGKRGEKKAVDAKCLAGGSSKKKLTDWASDDDSNFWADEADGAAGKKQTGPEELDDKEVEDMVLGGVDGDKKEDETSSGQNQEKSSSQNQEETSSGQNQEETSSGQNQENSSSQNQEETSSGKNQEKSSSQNQEETSSGQNQQETSSGKNQQPSIPSVEKVDEMKIDEKETDVVQISTSVQAAETASSPNANHQVLKRKKEDVVDTEEDNHSLLSSNDIVVPGLKTVTDRGVDNKEIVDDSSDNKADGKENDDKNNADSRLQSKSEDVCLLSDSMEEKADSVCSTGVSMEVEDGGDCSVNTSMEEKAGGVCSTGVSMEVEDGGDCSVNTSMKEKAADGISSVDTSSQEVKTDGEALNTTSGTSKESSKHSLDISSEANIPKTIENTSMNTSDIVNLPKELPDLTTAAENSRQTLEIPNTNCTNSNITDKTSTHDVINLNEDKQVSFGNENLEPLTKDEKIQNDTISNLDCHKLDDPSSLVTDKQTENLNMAVICVDNNETILSNPDDGVTNIDSDNSNDSDDVICIESKSAEPNKLHHFLSQAPKKTEIPVVTKNVTFMSSITEVPTFVCASVGFQRWGPVLHFNFTGDSSHLPTVMTISSPSSPSIERPSPNGRLKNSKVVYERIYPPIKSLVPHANSTGAVIKQRLRGLPCLSSAYLKVSQSHKLTHTLSQDETTHTKDHEDTASRHSVSKLHSGISKHRQQTTSSTQESLKSSSSGKPSSLLSSGSSSDSPKPTFSHVGSYMKLFQPADNHSISETDDHSATVLQSDTDDTGKKCNTLSLSAAISKLEKQYNSTFPKENTVLDENAEKPGPEIDNLLTEFHTALNHYLPSVEISTIGESHILNLLLSKSDQHTDILDESSNKAKTNLSIFQTWLLEKRYEYCEQLQKTNSGQNTNANVNVGLAVNSENKGSRSQPDVEIEMIVDANLTEDSVNKLSAPETHTENNVNNLNEDQTKNEPTLLDKTLNHSQKTLEIENRKRKFDSSEEKSEESVKMIKLNDDELLMLDNDNDKNMVSSCRREQEIQSKEEDMLADGDSFSEELEGELKKQVDVKAAAKTSEASDLEASGLETSSVTEKLNKTSNSCELISRHDSVNSKRLESERDDDSVHDGVKLPMEEAAECSEDTKSTLGGICKEITPMEVEDCKQEDSTKSTSSPVGHKQLTGDNLASKQSDEDELMVEDKNSQTLSKPLSRNGTDSDSLNPEDKNIEDSLNPENKNIEDSLNPENKNIEDTNKTTISKEEQHSNMTCSQDSPKKKQTVQLLEDTEDSSGILLAEGELKQQAEVTPNCTDTSQDGVAQKSANSTKDLDSKQSITSSTCNTKSNLGRGDETARKGSSHNPGTSEDFQICIGSSSDEDSEPHPSPQKLPQPTLRAVHPYSARDDSEADLFVVPNTSDEDYERDSYAKNEKKGNKKQRQVWRPCTKKDPYPTEERLHLMLEEAFFLSFGLGCLKIVDPEMKMLNLTQMWQQFNVLKEQFIPHYVAYHYFRSKGWVPKSGLKFGCDLILYRDGPPFYHGSYSVVVTVVKDTTLLPVHRNGSISFDQRKLNWISLAGLNRITEHVAKELMLCYVIWPGDLTQEESLSPDCLSRFKVKEVVVSRWVSSQEREDKIGEEDEIP